jgi:hypothetical protein
VATNRIVSKFSAIPNHRSDCGSQDEFQTLFPRTPGDVPPLQPDDRKSDRGDVRPQQPRRSLSHHVFLVIVPGFGEHRDLLDQRLSPRRVSINVPIAGQPLWSDGDLIGSPISITVPELPPAVIDLQIRWTTSFCTRPSSETRPRCGVARKGSRQPLCKMLTSKRRNSRSSLALRLKVLGQ